jgi:hypothetical protein
MKKYVVAATVAIAVAAAARQADATPTMNCYSVALSVSVSYDAIRTSSAAPVTQTANVSFLCDVSGITNTTGSRSATATLSLTSTSHVMTNPAAPTLPLSYSLNVPPTNKAWGSGPPNAVVTATFSSNGNAQPSGDIPVTLNVPGGQNARIGTYSDSPAFGFTYSYK